MQTRENECVESVSSKKFKPGASFPAFRDYANATRSSYKLILSFSATQLCFTATQSINHRLLGQPNAPIHFFTFEYFVSLYIYTISCQNRAGKIRFYECMDPGSAIVPLRKSDESDTRITRRKKIVLECVPSSIPAVCVSFANRSNCPTNRALSRSSNCNAHLESILRR